jgi:ABC-type methionine transport system permease subunit
MDLDMKTVMISIFSGLLAGGLLSLAIYEGFVRLIPDPAIIVFAFLVLFVVTGFVVGRLFKRME